MRQVTRKGLITMAAAGGVLALSGGYAHADSGAAGTASGSPGVLSGNSVQVPIDIPVNVCGNSVSVGGLLNPTGGNDCGNGSAASDRSGDRSADRSATPETRSVPGGSGNSAQAGDTTTTDRHSEPGTGRHRAPGGGATAEGTAQGSPGILSGNLIQAPIDIPVNLCGNSVTIGGLLNPAFGNSCSNDAEVPPPPPEEPEVPPVTPEKPVTPPANQPPEPNAPETQHLPEEQLAQTGGGGLELLIPASAGLLLAGAGSVLYRRSRSAA
ncbi:MULTISPECIES: chaplin [unclassified Streptomyces]|uniref:chaplin n=1 Tax=unclassified Streptomyces TaxID=2593676 RepID=UPI00379421CE